MDMTVSEVEIRIPESVRQLRKGASTAREETFPLPFRREVTEEVDQKSSGGGSQVVQLRGGRECVSSVVDQ